MGVCAPRGAPLALGTRVGRAAPAACPAGGDDHRVGPPSSAPWGQAEGMVHRHARRTAPGGQPGDPGSTLAQVGQRTRPRGVARGERGASWAGGGLLGTAVRHQVRCGEVLDVDHPLRRVWHVCTRSEQDWLPWEKRLGPGGEKRSPDLSISHPESRLQSLNTPKIPHTDSIEEFTRFWDTHDLTDFADQLAEVCEPIFERCAEEPVTIHLPAPEVEAVKRLAKVKGIEHAALIRQWVLEKLHRS